MRLSSFLTYLILPVMLSVAAQDSSGTGTGLTGDSQCSDVMCVSAIVNDSTVTYVLESTGSSTPGWMAMGFGNQMADSPMVIMWNNSDGTITLSQRSASGYVQPTVDSNPPRVASLLSDLSVTSGTTLRFVYSIPANSDTTQSIIWAYSETNPDDSSVSADIQKHDSAGVSTLNLTGSLSSDPTATGASSPGSSATAPASSGSESSLVPFHRFQTVVAAVLLFCLMFFA